MLKRTALAAVVVTGAFIFAGAASSQGTPSLRELYAGPPESWPRPTLHEGASFTEFGVVPPPPQNPDNPSTPAKLVLGERLFGEPKLSKSGQFACMSCHNRELGFGDGLQTSFGHDRKRGQRNAQPLFVAAWMTTLFWDGRSPSLEDQALQPISHPIEMAADRPTVEKRLNADESYRIAFAEAFGDDQRITLERVAQAIAVFERSLKPRRSKWDRVLATGGGTRLLTDQELQGLHLFRTKAGCANCHNGPLFTDGKFHNLGLSFYGRRLQDLGRYEVTRNPADVGAFRTPTLRNLTQTGPYMHNGIFPSLEGVVNFYTAGTAQLRPRPDQVGDPLFPKTSSLVKPLGLTPEERRALVAFLETL